MTRPRSRPPGAGGLRDRAARLGERSRASAVPKVIGCVALAGLVLIAGGLWVNSLVAPVVVEGRPTATVTPIPAPTPTTPTPTPSASTAASAGASVPASASPSAPTMASSGRFATATVNVDAVSSTGELRRYAVRTETSTKLDANTVATQIAAVLNDPRSWAGSGGIRFALVADPAKADFTITLSSPATAAKSCPITSGTCLATSDIVIDALAWTTTPATYDQNASDWQTYLTNHGLGTLLGEKDAGCAKAAEPASVMMAQQSDLRGCVANPWPFP